jgi:hypothetical protein
MALIFRENFEGGVDGERMYAPIMWNQAHTPPPAVNTSFSQINDMEGHRAEFYSPGYDGLGGFFDHVNYELWVTGWSNGSVTALSMDVSFNQLQRFSMTDNTYNTSAKGFRLSSFLAGSGSPREVACHITSGGKIRLVVGSTPGQSGYNYFDSSLTIPLNTWCRTRVKHSTITNQVSLEIYVGDNVAGSVPDETINAGAVGNPGGVYSNVIWGGPYDVNVPAPAGEIILDECAFWDTLNPQPIPVIRPIAPTAEETALRGSGWPPLVFTDIRAKHWKTAPHPDPSLDSNVPWPLTTPVPHKYENGIDDADVYSSYESHVNQVCRIPNGFNDQSFRNGLVICVPNQHLFDSATYSLGTIATTYIHEKEQDPRGYETGWVELENAGIGGPFGGLGGIGGMSQIFLAPQRMGPYVYGLGVYLESQLEKFVLWRFNSSTQFEILESFSSPMDGYVNNRERAAFNGIYGTSYNSLILGHGNCEMFVSDERPATIYFLAGRTATWWDDDEPHGMHVTTGPSYDSPTVSGPAWLNKQVFDPQAGDELLDPSLVFPWRAGDYGAPEIWFYKKIKKAGKYTGQIQIYRSRFRGDEWDTDWDDASNKVGIFGPLDELQLDDPTRELTNEHDPLNIKVARDPRYENRLRMIVDAGQQYADESTGVPGQIPQATYYERYHTRATPPDMWVLDSFDDGRTWTRTRKFPFPRRKGTVYGGPDQYGPPYGSRESNVLAFTVTDQGEAICGAFGGSDSGKDEPNTSPPWDNIYNMRATLVYPDRTGKGVGSQEATKTDHRRSTQREAWVQ